MAFKYKLAAKEFITLHIGSIYEFREHLEMWLPDFYRTFGSLTIVQHKKIAKERLNAAIKCALSKCCP